MPYRRCRGRRLWRERIAPPYEFQDEFYFADPWPADAAGGAALVAWWRPERLAAYSDGQSLTSWADMMGNQRPATPYTATKPVVKKAIRNGMDVVRFAGTTDVLGFLQTGNLSDWTIVVVCGNLSVATNAIDYAVAMTGGGVIVGGTDATYGFIGEFQTGAKYLISTSEPTGWGVNIYSPGHIYRDNVEVTYGSTVGTLDRLNLTDLGGRNDIANLGVIGDIAEVMIYNTTLGTDDRAGVSQYCRHRYNTP